MIPMMKQDVNRRLKRTSKREMANLTTFIEKGCLKDKRTIMDAGDETRDKDVEDISVRRHSCKNTDESFYTKLDVRVLLT